MTAKPPTAIFFDLDDTIVAYDGNVRPIWQTLSDAYAAKTDAVDASVLFQQIMEISRWYWGDTERHKTGRQDMKKARREIVRTTFGKLDLDTTDADSLADEYSKRRREEIELFPQARETLEGFQKANIRMALISNGEATLQREKLARFELEKYFDLILLEGELGFGKPEHRIFRLALDKMSLDAADVWMVGDSLTYDISPANELGIYTVWNDWKKKGLPSDRGAKPNRIVNSIHELL